MPVLTAATFEDLHKKFEGTVDAMTDVDVTKEKIDEAGDVLTIPNATLARCDPAALHAVFEKLQPAKLSKDVFGARLHHIHRVATQKLIRRSTAAVEACCEITMTQAYHALPKVTAEGITDVPADAAAKLHAEIAAVESRVGEFLNTFSDVMTYAGELLVANGLPDDLTFSDQPDEEEPVVTTVEAVGPGRGMRTKADNDKAHEGFLATHRDLLVTLPDHVDTDGGLRGSPDGAAEAGKTPVFVLRRKNLFAISRRMHPSVGNYSRVSIHPIATTDTAPHNLDLQIVYTHDPTEGVETMCGGDGRTVTWYFQLVPSSSNSGGSSAAATTSAAGAPIPVAEVIVEDSYRGDSTGTLHFAVHATA